MATSDRMRLPPISAGRRMEKEEAIYHLVMQGFQKDEALEYWNEPDAEKRKLIVDKVTQREREK